MKQKSGRYPWRSGGRKGSGLAYAYGNNSAGLLLIFIDRFALERYKEKYGCSELIVLDKYKDSRRISHAIVTNLFIPVSTTQKLISA